MPELLAIDDEPNLLYSLVEGLGSDSLRVVTARTAREGIERIRAQRPDAVLLDVRLPDMSGLDAFDRIRSIEPQLPVVIVTAYAATETAIEAMKRGAFEYLLKPLDLPQLRGVLERAMEQGRRTHVRAILDDEEGPAGADVDRIVGRSPGMQEVYKAIGLAAAQDVTVLVLGESGTGKELVARAIFQHSRRARMPFLAINCAAIPEAILESELFGHERGAFTGADRRRIGKFEQADGGTIFLDEVGDMAPTTQAKVLRLLQDGRFERLGGNETIHADVRLIAATNRGLERMVAEGRFRHDLYYRLKVFTIEIPPLRERLSDLPLLVEHYVRLLNRELGRQVRSIDPETMSRLAAHDWPGNVRELQSILKSALIRSSGEILTPESIPADLTQPYEPGSPEPGGGGLDVIQLVRGMLASGESGIYQKVISAVDRVVLEEVLRHARGNQVRSSELLGISRNTLRAKLRAEGLSVEKQLGTDPDHTDQ